MTNINKRIGKLFKSPNNISIKELHIVLKYFGYKLSRVNGSHFIFKDSKGDTQSIPVHNSKIKKHYIKKLLKIFYG
ncbi:hypothetical protein A3B60_02340 [Candidatus Peregrinibacteria bacterium RIFCSPLOWO2_01_FULL_39_12]|nr:MAG: hypothetical protein A3B60_02340 [Candidatus Peregrinibacteria bacterium RIFCSPLOWO2_01_FULL_39_12]